MAKGGNHKQYTEDWFLSKGYTKNSDGSFQPPPFKNPFTLTVKEEYFPINKTETTNITKNESADLMPIWSEEDVLLLKLFYEQKKDIKYISEKLKKTPKSVKSKACSLKITNSTDYTYLEKETIIHFYEEVSKVDFNFLENVSLLLDRPKENISRFARKLGLTSYGRKIIKIKECKVCGKEMTLTGSSKSKNTVCGEKCLSELASKNATERIKNNGHPKGMLGKKHTDENKKKQSVIAKENWDNKTEKEVSDIILKRQKTKEANGTVITPRLKTTWKQGWRNIGGYDKYYRSRWEANYARYLEFLKQNGEIKNWFHEPKTFWFEDILRGCRSYLPDFLVINKDNSEEYHEVKGWMDDKSKTKLKRMDKYYPNIKIVLIQEAWFKENSAKLKPIIKGWE